MRRSLPPLNALRAFEAAGRHQSFSRAADELGVSHSSISRHVRGLEDRLGVQLFQEASRGVRLSPDGAAYLAQVSPAFDLIGEATEGLAEAPAGTVSVNSEPLFATKWLVPRLAGFSALHPGIDVRLEASRHLADVARYEADVAIRFIPPNASYPGAALLSDAMLYPFAAPTVAPGPVAPEALLDLPLMRDRTNGTWRAWFARAGVPLPQDFAEEVWRMSSALAVEAAIAGQGVLLVSEEVVSHEVALGRLVRLSDVGFREGGYHMLLAEGAARRKPVRLFRDWLRARTARWRHDQPDG
ncbi:LysR family transcriptional regulator [Sulfitobacter albidus]|uniref:LysR family transcriptional regulator n=1 Tax=Sulfitobacter albidus TaxID=2829501 RepID=A0A975JCL3_9RHOB|nr:LysR substrate-binding domain-containing protein [Sulfitobacter albidus]QUJ75791.1 LysR family transcriptional regulator [Sulfitobacter albidus]